MELRDYQRESVDSVYRHLREKDTNPCVVIPTAGGKSVCIAQVAKDAVAKWHGRVLVLAHVKELVDQNARELEALCPGLPVGVYSAGLGRRDTEQDVIVAGIQSIYRRIDLFKPFDLVMVDEVHMVPPDGEGRYRTFLQAAERLNPKIRMVGWTATPYRTQGGLICRPENLFNEICHEVNVRDLIERGYISRISAHAGSARADLGHLHMRAGEFVAEDVERAMGEERIVTSACREIVEMTRDRKACLVFCTSVAHCRRVAELISGFSGEECAVVTGDTPSEERELVISRMKGESAADLFGNPLPPLKYCCNVSVLTTGTNIRRLDTIALLRPTASAGLFVQMVGRGFRLSPETGKTECLVLDFGKNVERFGPIDAIRAGEPRTGGSGEGGALVRECPRCGRYVAISTALCPECGCEFPVERGKRIHEAHADNAAILSGEVSVTTRRVAKTEFMVWTKRGAAPGAPKTVRVTYTCPPDDMESGASYVDFACDEYSEWICPEHTGYARSRFERWWREHADPGCPVPETAEDACECFFMGLVRETKAITMRHVSGNRYPEIVACELGGLPAMDAPVPEGDDGDFGDMPF
ncbi:MAG: DEAD/DEAH box helicase [Kiritimatiellae bacterium]|nr:DEAD/DEAH box helicase [Kiritimatiellia bacterium]